MILPCRAVKLPLIVLIAGYVWSVAAELVDKDQWPGPLIASSAEISLPAGEFPVQSLPVKHQLSFSNNTGVQVTCRGQGRQPWQVKWIDANNQPLRNIPQLRTLLPNGTLWYHKFAPHMYRTEIHTGTIRCIVRSQFGTALGNKYRIQAVMEKDYQVALTEVTAVVGRTAVIQCHVTPRNASSYVQVTSWRFGSLQLTAGHMSDRLTSWRDILLIRGVTSDDARVAIRCEITNLLTHEALLSKAAHINVIRKPIEPRMSPAIPESLKINAGEELKLCCAVENAAPSHKIRWYISAMPDTVRQMLPVVLGSSVRLMAECLSKRVANVDDSGFYRCVYQSGSAQLSRVINVQVEERVQVEIKPSRILMRSSQSGHLICNVTSQYPVSSLRWFRNGQRLPSADGSSSLTLAADGASLTGIYQCQADDVIATAEVRLSSLPEVRIHLERDAVYPGQKAVLICLVQGQPDITVTWQHRKNKIQPDPVGRLHVETRSVEYGEVSSQLIISPVLTRDAGKYTCRAENDAGETHRSTKLNIYGQAVALPRRSLTVAARSPTLLHCPVTGYPLKHFRWLRNAEKLEEHQVFSNGSLEAVEGSGLKSGEYSCEVTGGDGTRITGFVDVTVLEPPQIAEFSFTGDLVQYQRAQAACLILSGDLPITISWLKDGNQLESRSTISSDPFVVRGDFFSNLVFKSLQPHHAGVYTCQAVNSVATRQFSAPLSILVPPFWNHQILRRRFVLAEAALLNCSATGYPTPKVTWFKADKNTTFLPVKSDKMRVFVNETAGVIKLTETMLSDGGNYSCKASNGVGEIISQFLEIFIDVPARFEVHRRNITVPVSGSSNLTCSPTGNAPITISWLRDNQPINVKLQNQQPISAKMSSESVLRLVDVRTNDRGHYTCVARNVHGNDRTTWEVIVVDKPGRPVDLTVMNVRSRSAELTWSPPENTDSQPEQYVIQLMELAASPLQHIFASSGISKQHLDWSLARNVTVSAHQRGLLISNLQPSTEYLIRIFAVNSHGPGLVSDVITASTLAEPPSGPPLKLKLKPLSSSQILVSWNSPVSASTFGRLVGYNVHYKSKDSPMQIRVVRRPEPSVVLRDLMTYTTYTVYVTAFNYAGSGPPSASASVNTLEDKPTASPTNVRCNRVSATTIQLSWQSLPQQQRAGNIVGYQIIWRKRVLQYSDQVHRQTTGVEEFELASLSPFTDYLVILSAATSVGHGRNSEPVTCTTLPTVPEAPSRIKITADSNVYERSRFVYISWNYPQNKNGQVSNYTLYLQRSSRVQKINVDAALSSIKMSRSRLENVDKIWITASSMAGESSASRKIKTKRIKSARAGIVSFSTELAALLGETVTLPCVSTQHLLPPVWRHEQAAISDGHHLTRLQNGSLHIRHVIRAHSGNWSCAINSGESITVQLRVIGRPVVTSPQVVMATQSTLKITWKLVNDGNSPIQKYHVKYGVKDSGRWRSLVSLELTTELQLTDLLCGTVYTVIVTAENSLARGSDSQPLHAATRGNRPSKPPVSRLATSNSTCISIWLYDWPSKCDVTSYNIILSQSNSGATSWRTVETFQPNTDLGELCHLRPATWYKLHVTANSKAGNTSVEYQIATTTVDGEQLLTAPMADNYNTWQITSGTSLYVMMTLFCSVICICSASVCFVKWRQRMRKRRPSTSHRLDTYECSADFSSIQLANKSYATHSEIIDDPPLNYGNCKHHWDDVSPYATLDLNAGSKIYGSQYSIHDTSIYTSKTLTLDARRNVGSYNPKLRGGPTLTPFSSVQRSLAQRPLPPIVNTYSSVQHGRGQNNRYIAELQKTFNSTRLEPRIEHTAVKPPEGFLD